MKQLSPIPFDFFVDYLLSQYQESLISHPKPVVNSHSRALIILLDISTPLSIPSKPERSTFTYLHNVSNFEIIHVDTFQKLLVLLKHLELSNNNGYRMIGIWGLSDRFKDGGWSHSKVNLVMNSLVKLSIFGHDMIVVLGDLNDIDIEYRQILDLWIPSIDVQLEDAS